MKSEALMTQAQEQNTQLLAARPELAPILAGEARMMRVILYNIISTMTSQIDASLQD